jgi:quercetin dioxygenase-like cupin family protein
VHSDPTAGPRYARRDELPSFTRAGCDFRILAGEHLTLSLVDLPPGAEVAEHEHPHEQLGMVVEGSITMRIAGEERTLGPGDVYRVAPGLPHGGRAGTERTVVLDAFAPAREDYHDLAV